MMASDMRKKPPETIEDLFRMNFTLADVDEHTMNTIDEDRRPNGFIVPWKDYPEFFTENIGDSSKKLAFIFVDQFINFKIIKLGIEPNRIKERIISSNAGIAMLKNNFFFHLLSDLIHELNAGGIPQFLDQLYLNFALIKRNCPTLSGPQVMTTDDLDYGFAIWFIACGISLLGFFSEFLKFYFEKLLNFFKLTLRNFLGLALLISILREKLKFIF